ncbi:major facilitator superfamily domain-containing protein [Aspergillus venezuelensis]
MMYPGTAAAISAENPICQNPVSIKTIPKLVTIWMIPKNKDSLLIIERYEPAWLPSTVPSEGRDEDANTDAVDDHRVAFLDTFTPKVQKKIVRKVDYRILIIIGVIYLVKQIDINNASSVKVLAADKPTNILIQLNMTADEYNWVQSIYDISYIIFELPSNLFLKKMTPRVFQTRICFLWGMVLACHAAVRNKEGLYAARFFLGLAEAGLFPRIMTHLFSWYRGDEMGKPHYIIIMTKISGVFLIEGMATMAFAGLVWIVYPDYPRSARTEKWLTPREQEFIEMRLTENAPKTQDEPFSWWEVVATLKDLRMWSFMLAYVCMNTGGFGLTWFLLIITTNLGFATLPGTDIIAIISVAWLLKRASIRRPQAKGAIYTACVLGSMFSACLAIPFWAWRTSTLRATIGTAFAMGLYSGVGQLRGVIGPQIFRSNFAADGYRVSYAICVGALGGCFLFNCAEKEGRLYTEDEVKFFDERRSFSKALKMNHEVGAV